MSISVNEFYYEPGVNDTEYIEILKKQIERDGKIIKKQASEITRLIEARKTGEWNKRVRTAAYGDVAYDVITFQCSECGDVFSEDGEDYYFCPYCGAYMKGDTE